MELHDCIDHDALLAKSFSRSCLPLLRGVVDPNLPHQAPFYCTPCEGSLAQGESAEVVVVFQPSNQRPYEDVLQVINIGRLHSPYVV
jgi:hypothetical protein